MHLETETFCFVFPSILYPPPLFQFYTPPCFNVGVQNWNKGGGAEIQYCDWVALGQQKVYLTWTPWTPAAYILAGIETVKIYIVENTHLLAQIFIQKTGYLSTSRLGSGPSAAEQQFMCAWAAKVFRPVSLNNPWFAAAKMFKQKFIVTRTDRVH